MTKGYSKALLTTLLLTMLASCKIVANVPRSGSIEYVDGRDFCGSGESCSTDVVDSFFDETFVAVPEEGSVFSMWTRDSLCPMTDRNCRISTRNFDKFSELQRLLDSGQKGLMDPIFSPLVNGVDCRDDSVPLALTALIQSDPFISFFSFDDCSFSSDRVNRLFSGIAFWRVSAGELPIDNGIRGRFGPGDVMLTLGRTDLSTAMIADGEDAIVVYIDADDSKETGKPSHGVLGADYRAWVSNCSYIEEVVFGKVKIRQFEGLLEYWSLEDKRWRPVEDQDFEFKATGLLGSSDEDWDIALFTGFGTEGIGIPKAVAVHVEALGQKCQLPQNPRIKLFAGVVKN